MHLFKTASALIAASHRDHTTIVDLLVKGGALYKTIGLNHNVYSHAFFPRDMHVIHAQEGTSALIAAAGKGHADIVDLLIKGGANVNCVDNVISPANIILLVLTVRASI